jgi:hypothetical protein
MVEGRKGRGFVKSLKSIDKGDVLAHEDVRDTLSEQGTAAGGSAIMTMGMG